MTDEKNLNEENLKEVNGGINIGACHTADVSARFGYKPGVEAAQQVNSINQFEMNHGFKGKSIYSSNADKKSIFVNEQQATSICGENCGTLEDFFNGKTNIYDK